jgi:hypothetical protein
VRFDRHSTRFAPSLATRSKVKAACARSRGAAIALDLDAVLASPSALRGSAV